MNNHLKASVLSLLALAIIGTLIILIIPSKPATFDPIIASCNNGRIGGLGTSSTAISGYQFDIIVPNGECKNSVILSLDNYTRLQNNVGYFTVKNKTPVLAVPTTGYCPLETWIWEGHLRIYNMTKYEKWMLSDYCKMKTIYIHDNIYVDDNINKTTVVPEFGSVAMIILVISISSIIAVTAKSKVIPRF